MSPVRRQPYGQMPSYLLRARTDEFERWRAAAEAHGQTFADYTRDALEAHTAALAKGERRLPPWLTEHYRHR